MKEIFVKQFTSFSEREGGFSMEDKYLSLDIAGGEKWKSERKLLSPTFTAGKIKMMIKSIVNLTDTLVEHVDNNIKNKEKGQTGTHSKNLLSPLLIKLLKRTNRLHAKVVLR